MKTVKIIGVPEHFNLPWQLCIENGEFEEAGLDLQWTDVPEGTGKMCEMLRNHQTDLAVILTEGIFKDISNGNDAVIVQEYVSSPLQWGIHVAYNAPYEAISDLEHKKVAISRKGSGSQLMAIVNAKNNGWDTENLSYEIVNTLDGAIQALTEKQADYFMWDRFMTQPIVDQKVFRRIGVCPTPWPCFVVVARKEFLQENKSAVRHIMEIINATTAEFKMIPSIDKTLAQRYNQKVEDIREWLQMTTWSQKNITPSKFEKIQKQLVDLDIITDELKYNEVIL